MAYEQQRPDFSGILAVIEMLKYYHDIGIFDRVVRGAAEVCGDDYYEFAELGLENAAPDFDLEEAPMNGNDGPMAEDEPVSGECDHYHRIYRFSSPEMKEYYRLCRLIERQRSIDPDQNPFVGKADAYYCARANGVDAYGGLWMFFDSDIKGAGGHTTEMVVEVCPDEYFAMLDLVMCIRDMLGYYAEHTIDVRLAFLSGPPACLPALPAPKGEEA